MNFRAIPLLLHQLRRGSQGVGDVLRLGGNHHEVHGSGEAGCIWNNFSILSFM